MQLNSLAWIIHSAQKKGTYFLHTCKIFITFEVVDNQSNIYVPMCKGKTIFSNTQAQIDFLDLFEVEKKVEMSFSAPELSSLGVL